MVHRSYEEACAAAHALDLVGERWALLIVRELLFGAKRFTDLRASLPALSPNVLTQRLTELEDAGIVRHHKLPPPAAAHVYELTDWGRDLDAVIMALGRWGVRSPTHSKDAYMSTDAFMLSLRTMLDRQLAAGLKGTVELRVGEAVYNARIAKGEMQLVRGAAAAPDVVIEGAVAALASVVYGGRTLMAAIRAGDVVVQGDRALARGFLDLFPLPATMG